MKKKRFLISGGGTGGHIFPALAIAKELEKRHPKSEILFVGASDRMEMKKVPESGYQIKGLWISGFKRSLSIRNILFPFKLFISLLRSFLIVLCFKPDMVIGTGGYASGPILLVASLLKIPTLIQEQNSYPGITNKLLGSLVTSICVAYSGLDRFFPKNKIHFTGNPIREEFESGYNKSDTLQTYGFSSKKPVVLIIGGSLGSKKINETILENYSWFVDRDVQLIWQTGALYYERCDAAKSQLGNLAKIHSFISEMVPVLKVADVIVSRAGAIALSEICALGKASILIPSPNVAEDHQKKNALALSENNAAVLVEECDIEIKLFETLDTLINKPKQRELLELNSKKMSKLNATESIVNLIEELIDD